MKLDHSSPNTSVNVLQHQFPLQESFGTTSSTELNIQFCGEARGTHAGKSGGSKIVGCMSPVPKEDKSMRRSVLETKFSLG